MCLCSEDLIKISQQLCLHSNTVHIFLAPSSFRFRILLKHCVLKFCALMLTVHVAKLIWHQITYSLCRPQLGLINKVQVNTHFKPLVFLSSSSESIIVWNNEQGLTDEAEKHCFLAVVCAVLWYGLFQYAAFICWSFQLDQTNKLILNSVKVSLSFSSTAVPFLPLKLRHKIQGWVD